MPHAAAVPSEIRRMRARHVQDPRSIVTSVDAAVSAARRDCGAGNNSFVHVADDAREVAARRTAEPGSGPLHGVPLGIKDVIDVAGLPTAAGSRAVDVPTASATVVERLTDAGAVVVGKTHTHQFAFGTTGDVAATGPVTNPHDDGAMAGGSSGGSAVAVAKGIVPTALGTDTAGSVRIPAALVGVVGFKPTHGTVPDDGVLPLSPSLDVVGVLSPTVADAATTWEIISDGPGTGDAPLLKPARIRLGDVSERRGVRLSSRVRSVFEAALATITGGGAQVVDGPPVAFDVLRREYLTIIGKEGADVHRERLAAEPEAYDPEIRERIEGISGVSTERYEEALSSARAEAETLLAAMAGLDALVLPTVPIDAPRIGQREVRDDSGLALVWGGLANLTSAWNVVGFPAISLPVSVPDGLPIGLQLVGRTGEDESLLDVARTIEALLNA